MRAVMASRRRTLQYHLPEPKRIRLLRECDGNLLYSSATWCGGLGDSRSRIRFNPESIRGVVSWEARRTIVVNEDGNRNYPYADNDGKQWDENWNWIENDFDRNGRVAISGNWQGDILLMLGGSVYELPHPSAEHLSDFDEFFRDHYVFFVVERLEFPEELNKKFCEVKSYGRAFEIKQFFLSREKARNEDCLKCFYERRVYFRS